MASRLLQFSLMGLDRAPIPFPLGTHNKCLLEAWVKGSSGSLLRSAQLLPLLDAFPRFQGQEYVLVRFLSLDIGVLRPTFRY